MIETRDPRAPSTLELSLEKYGTIILADGFTQLPRAVEDFLCTLNLCPTARLLIFILLSYRWRVDQECFPSVRTLAKRCKVGPRRINQLTAEICALGLLVKRERFAGKSQLSNSYDLEPLLLKIAAWKDAEVAAQLAEEEARADEPFQPANVLEEAAQIISEEFGEPSPRQVRSNVKRLSKRFHQHSHLAWPDFASIVEQSVRQTEERHREPTKTGRVFEKLIPYFFSALDYRLSCEQPAPPPLQPAPSPEPIHRTYQPGHAPHHRAAQPAKPAQTTDILAQRATARRAAEAAGRTKVRAPETLALHIKAAALTFNDDQEKSSVQRAANLMADAGLDEQTMLDLVAQARAAASQSHKITKKNRHGKINRMPYFFTILRAKILEELDHQ